MFHGPGPFRSQTNGTETGTADDTGSVPPVNTTPRMAAHFD